MPTPSSRERIVFDREGVQAVDHAAIHEYGIPGIVLMENAARCLCEHSLKMLDSERNALRRSVFIICGSGNNGGDGYALARHLHNHRIDVSLVAIGSPKPESDAGINRAICEKMGLPIIDAKRLNSDAFAHASMIVDAIFGTGLDRPIEPANDAARVIDLINTSGKPVLAVDVPSGLNCDSGRPVSPNGPCVKAMVTATFVGVKIGFWQPDARQWLGEVVVCGIGAPREVVERCGRWMRSESK